MQAVSVLLALALPCSEAGAHHPVGIPQYRETGGEMVMIYNVLTEDYVVRLQARPGRPVFPPAGTVHLSVDVRPRDPGFLFEGGTWLSVAEDLGDRGEREVAPAVLKSTEPGARAVEMVFEYRRPADYLVKVEFTESPGREVLSFPLAVARSGPSVAIWALRVGLPVVLAAGALALARAAAARRRRRREEAGAEARP